MPTGDPFKLVTPTGPGVAADIYQSAPPAPPLVVQPHGTAGGLAVAPEGAAASHQGCAGALGGEPPRRSAHAAAEVKGSPLNFFFA